MNRVIRIGPLTITYHFFIILVFYVFYVTKIIRAFAKTKEAGGIWNYIQLLLIIIGVVFILLDLRNFINNRTFLFIMFTCLFCFTIGFFYLRSSSSSFFRFITLLYPAAILAIACHETSCYDMENGVFILAIFYSTAAIYVVNMISVGEFSALTGATADVYYVLGLFPLALIQERVNKLIPISVCGFTLLISGKRTGIIAYILMVICFYFYQIFSKKSLMKHILYLIEFAVIVVLFIVLFSEVTKEFNPILYLRIERLWKEEDSSGRYAIWDLVIRLLKNSAAIRLLFGHGTDAVLHVMGTKAHNDYLEVLYDFGIFAMLGYIGFYISAIIDFIRMIIHRYEYAVYFLMSLIFSISLSMFSFYFIDPTYITSGMLCFGFFLTDFQMKHTPEASLSLIGKRNGENA